MKFRIVLLSAIILFGSNQIFSQAWVKKKGEFYAKLGFNTIISNSVFDYNGDVVDSVKVPGTDSLVKVPKLMENMIQLYGMYGLTDKLTLISSIPLKSITDQDRSFTRTSIADLELGGVYGAKTDGFRVTPGLFVGIPTGFYSENDPIITGDGEFNIMPRLYFGNGKSKFYYTGFAGFNYRTGGRYHEIDGLIEGGYKIKKLYLILKILYKESLTGGTEVFNITGIYDNGQAFISENFSLYYKYTENLHFTFNVGGAIYARNAQASPSFNIGIAYEK